MCESLTALYSMTHLWAMVVTYFCSIIHAITPEYIAIYALNSQFSLKDIEKNNRGEILAIYPQ